MKSSKNKKVVFLSLSGIGNLLMQFPAIKLLKQAHPNWHITVWVAPRGTAELARSQSYIDEVIEMPIKASPLQHLRNIIQLRSRAFDYGIVLSPGQLIKSALYMVLAGIPTRIGNTYPFRNNSESTLFLTNAIEEKPDMHDIEQNIRLLEPFGIHLHEKEAYEIEIPDKNKQEAQQYIQKDCSYIGIHAGSAQGFEGKQWPVERFAEVGNALLAQDPTLQLLIFGSPQEEAQKEHLVSLITSGRAINVTLSLMTTAALMSHCKMGIANDSGLMHLAAAAGIPVVAVFGPTNEHLTGPRGKNSIVVRAPGTKPVYVTEKNASLGSSPHSTILAVTPQQVLDVIPSIVL